MAVWKEDHISSVLTVARHGHVTKWEASRNTMFNFQEISLFIGQQCDEFLLLLFPCFGEKLELDELPTGILGNESHTMKYRMEGVWAALSTEPLLNSLLIL